MRPRREGHGKVEVEAERGASDAPISQGHEGLLATSRSEERGMEGSPSELQKEPILPTP